MHEELGATLGAAVYERRGDRRGYRNGTKARTLTGPTGPLALTLPRATLFTPTGPKEWTSALVPRYQRRIREVNEAVVATYLAGGNTRRLRAALGPLLKQAPLSRSTVSRIVATLRSSLEAWQARSLTKLGAVYLYLDALALRVRSAGKMVSVLVLGAVAVGSDGQKQLVGLELRGRVVRGLEGFPRQPQRPGAGGSAAEHHRRARGAPPRCRGGLAPGGGAALLRALSPASPIYAHRAMVREPQECALSFFHIKGDTTVGTRAEDTLHDWSGF